MEVDSRSAWLLVLLNNSNKTPRQTTFGWEGKRQPARAHLLSTNVCTYVLFDVAKCIMDYLFPLCEPFCSYTRPFIFLCSLTPSFESPFSCADSNRRSQWHCTSIFRKERRGGEHLEELDQDLNRYGRMQWQWHYAAWQDILRLSGWRMIVATSKGRFGLLSIWKEKKAVSKKITPALRTSPDECLVSQLGFIFPLF